MILMDGPGRKAAAFQWCLSALSNTGTINAGNATLQLTDELPRCTTGRSRRALFRWDQLIEPNHPLW